MLVSKKSADDIKHKKLPRMKYRKFQARPCNIGSHQIFINLFSLICVHNLCRLLQIVGGTFTLCMLDEFCMYFYPLLNFSKVSFSKNSFRNNIRVPNRLEPDQALHVVRPDVGPNCLQRLSADNKCCY